MPGTWACGCRVAGGGSGVGCGVGQPVRRQGFCGRLQTARPCEINPPSDREMFLPLRAWRGEVNGTRVQSASILSQGCEGMYVRAPVSLGCVSGRLGCRAGSHGLLSRRRFSWCRVSLRTGQGPGWWDYAVTHTAGSARASHQTRTFGGGLFFFSGIPAQGERRSRGVATCGCPGPVGGHGPLRVVLRDQQAGEGGCTFLGGPCRVLARRPVECTYGLPRIDCGWLDTAAGVVASASADGADGRVELRGAG